MIQIVVIEDKEQDQDLIFSLLSSQKGFEITGYGKDGYDALKLAEQYQPHIVILDLWGDSFDGPELVPLIKRKSPATAVIILSGYESDEYAGKAISAGASGFLIKKTDMNKLADSVRTVYNGGCFINTMLLMRTFGLLSTMVKDRKAFPGGGAIKTRIPATINQIERRIMANIGRGYSNKEIAAKLDLKPGTIRNYLSSILRKTGLKSRTQVAIFALKSGLSGPAESRELSLLGTAGYPMGRLG